MTATKKNEFEAAWPLLQNSLVFYEQYRGRVREQHGTFLLESDRPDFSYAVLGPDKKTLPDTTRLVHVAPWSGDWDAELSARGFVPQAGMIWMTLERLTQTPDADVAIRVAQSEQEWEIFSEIQTRGFLEDEASYRDWHDWLHAANLRNRGAADQVFYIADFGEQSAGVTLLLRRGDVAGIYAVATLPAFRRRGISTALLTRAVADARTAGASTVTLQVNTGSPAESFYRNLGFVEAFGTRIWSR